MGQAARHPDRRAVGKIALAVLAGLVVLLLLAPAHGVDTDPPQCFSLIGYDVPCGDGWAIAGGAAAAVVVGLVLWVMGRRSHDG